MQVEVSKYTEGLSEKRMRPNEMPVSLIHYDGESTIRSIPLPFSGKLSKLYLLAMITSVSVLRHRT
jgi:hypothetical protein